LYGPLFIRECEGRNLLQKFTETAHRERYRKVTQKSCLMYHLCCRKKCFSQLYIYEMVFIPLRKKSLIQWDWILHIKYLHLGYKIVKAFYYIYCIAIWNVQSIVRYLITVIQLLKCNWFFSEKVRIFIDS
jgi:hypothetical protein